VARAVRAEAEAINRTLPADMSLGVSFDSTEFIEVAVERVWQTLGEALVLVLIVMFCIFPFYWMVTTSLKTQIVALDDPPVWWFTPTLANYWEVLFVDKVGPALINSLIVATSTTALAILLGCPAAYALARFEFRGKTDLWFWFITNRFVSPVVLVFPVFLISRELGLRDTHLALILMYLTFTLPIVIWI